MPDRPPAPVARHPVRTHHSVHLFPRHSPVLFALSLAPVNTNGGSDPDLPRAAAAGILGRPPRRRPSMPHEPEEENA